ncbi:MAG: AbrB/MazE/SpoVT family DNA-binding domain-containing protein [bacterium]|nr:AbrB/MazE/SpoVT family DNA-binding domain-containing protein [bacterium]
MANKKFSQRNTRKIIKVGSSFVVSIPVEILKKLGWKEKQKVVVKKIHGGVTIRDWKK